MITSVLFLVDRVYATAACTPLNHGVAQLIKALPNDSRYYATEIITAMMEDKERAASVPVQIPAGSLGGPENFKVRAVFLALGARVCGGRCLERFLVI